MDTAKYLAKVEQAALAQVLTTSSNNACFTRTAWTFEGNTRIPERDVPIPVSSFSTPSSYGRPLPA